MKSAITNDRPSDCVFCFPVQRTGGFPSLPKKSNDVNFDHFFKKKNYELLPWQINIISYIMICVFILYQYSIKVLNRYFGKLGQTLHCLTLGKKYTPSFTELR
jgi:hypothetical protein